MKILWLFNHYALPPEQAGGNRHFYLAKNLLNLGWETYIFASGFNYLTRKNLSQRKGKFTSQIIEGVNFIWVNLPVFRDREILRVLSMCLYSLKVLFPKCTSSLSKPHLIIGSSVHPFACLSAYILSRIHRVPFIFEVRDLWPETLIAYKKISSNGIIAHILRYVEKFLYKRSCKIIVTLPLAHNYITGLGINRDKIIWISNGVNLDTFSSIKPKTEVKDEFSLLYLGSHGRSNGLDLLINALKIIKDKKNSPKKISVNFVGDGPLKKNLINMVKSLNLHNIHFHDPVKRTDLDCFIVNADAFLIMVPKLPELYKYGISMNKIFDYMACKRPVIITTDFEQNPVSQSGAGVCVLPGDPDKLADAILEISLLDNTCRNNMGIQGYKFVQKNYCYKILAAKFCTVLDSLS